MTVALFNILYMNCMSAHTNSSLFSSFLQYRRSTYRTITSSWSRGVLRVVRNNIDMVFCQRLLCCRNWRCKYSTAVQRYQWHFM